MKEQLVERYLVVVPEGVSEKFVGILSSIGIEPDVVCVTGEDGILAAQEGRAVVLTAWQLPDMSGAEFARRIKHDADVLMLVPHDFDAAEAADCGALLLRNPISQDALMQAIRATKHCQRKMFETECKLHKLERMLEERKTIDKAKGRLIDELHMGEKQAHYYIQKKSMDSGRRIVDVAKEILDAAELRGDIHPSDG